MAAVLRIDTHRRDGAYVVAVDGELDMGSVDGLRTTVGTLVADTLPSVVIDLREISFIDSSGLHALLALQARAREAGRELHLVRGPEPVMRVFQIARVDDLFHWVDGPPED